VTPPPPVKDLLALRPMPEVASALRARSKRIMERWTEAVEQYVPDADPLTVKQVRNSIPTVLEKIALALESDRPEAVGVLEEVGTAHGVARFQEHYNIDEVMVEYRLLRRIIFDELQAVLGAKLSFADAIAVDMGIDTALHRGVMTFVAHLAEKLDSPPQRGTAVAPAPRPAGQPAMVAAPAVVAAVESLSEDEALAQLLGQR